MSDETRCGRRNNIEFTQLPYPLGGMLPNGESKLFILNMNCKECPVGVQVVGATGKECQWWINIANMKHATCHIKVSS